MPVTIKVQPDPKYGIVSKVGSIECEYGVRGGELERMLQRSQSEFVRVMEMRGLTLARISGIPNPVWLSGEDGRLNVYYPMDWEGVRRPKEVRTDGTVVELPNRRERSLEETGGMVEYRIVGLFWAPERSIEILKAKDEIKDEERASRNPRAFGRGGIQLPVGPNYPGDEALRPTQKKASPTILKGIARRQQTHAKPRIPERPEVDDGQRRIVIE